MNTKKIYIGALLILIAPLFLSANIFTDMDKSEYLERQVIPVTCFDNRGNTIGGGQIDSPNLRAAHGLCISPTESKLLSDTNQLFINDDCYSAGGTSTEWITNKYYVTLQHQYTDWRYACSPTESGSDTRASIGAPESTESCDPTFPTYNYPIDTNEDDEYDKCVDPNQIPLFDSCSMNDIYSNPVTEPQACIAKSDGSKCAVTAVDIGNDQSVYMPTENNCYSDVYPVLDENGGIGNMPDDTQCTQSGALQYCPADPETSCTETECDSGCGYINDQFICVTPTDNDNNDGDGDGDGDGNNDGDGDGNNDGDDNGNNDGDDDGNNDGDGDGNNDGDGDGNNNGDGDGNNGGNGNGNGNGQCTGNDCLPCVDNQCTPTGGEQGSFDIEAAEAELEDMKQQLQDKINDIKEESKTLIPAINGGNASFNSCFDITSVNGHTENRCLTEYADEMSIISKALLFIFTVISAFIVLSPARTK